MLRQDARCNRVARVERVTARNEKRVRIEKSTPQAMRRTVYVQHRGAKMQRVSCLCGDMAGVVTHDIFDAALLL